MSKLPKLNLNDAARTQPVHIPACASESAQDCDFYTLQHVHLAPFAKPELH
jgi:hypothetical protein